MGEKDKAVSGDRQCSRTSSADTDHTDDDPYQLCKRCHRARSQDTNWKAQADTAVTWSAKESRSEVQLLTDRILIRVEKANGAVQFLSRDGKKLLTENPSEPRLLLDTQTWNFFAWDKNERLKSKGVLADDFMDLSTKAAVYLFWTEKTPDATGTVQ